MTNQSKKDPKEAFWKPEGIPLVLASSPHVTKNTSVVKIMWSVILALLPASVMAVIYFGRSAVFLIVVCVISSLITEVIIRFIKGQSLIIKDGSAIITGLLLALTLPPTFPLSSAVIGSVFAIAIGKQVFGGLGYNIFNPALIGRAFLQASFPVPMTTWVLPFVKFDGISAATPLGLFKFEKISTDLLSLLTGNIGGTLGETCALAIIGGGLFLLILHHADWRIPLSCLATVLIISTGFWLVNDREFANPLFHLLSGGLLLGAFFMATDMVTSPITPKGTWIFGMGAGVLIMVIRLFGGLAEGVMYSILLMNAVTPLINRYTKPQIFGEKPK
ncbi:RnfABCDGE type electron transport complex subunit D [bacterium]|nr:RnfABCDGE type electron transport complex subunit D [bacterium]